MSNMQNFNRDCMCRIVLLGDEHVGKSSFVSRLFKEDFDENYNSTIGVDYRSKQFSYKNVSSRIHVFDSSGHPDLKNLSRSLYEYAQGFIFIYSIDNRESFNSIKQWVQIVNNQRKNGSSFILLANKKDLQNRQISQQQGRVFAQQQNMHFFEVSSKQNTNIQQSISVLVEDILKFHSLSKPAPVQKQKKEISFIPILVFIMMILLSLLI